MPRAGFLPRRDPIGRCNRRMVADDSNSCPIGSRSAGWIGGHGRTCLRRARQTSCDPRRRTVRPLSPQRGTPGDCADRSARVHMTESLPRGSRARSGVTGRGAVGRARGMQRCPTPVQPPAPARAAPRRRGRLPVAKRICVVGRRQGRACEELQPALQPSGAEGGAAPGTKWRPTLSPPPAPACTAPPHRGSLSAAPRRPRGTGNTAGACKTTRPHPASLSAPHGAGRLGSPASLVVGNSPPLRRGMRRRVYRTGRGGARSPCHRPRPAFSQGRRVTVRRDPAGCLALRPRRRRAARRHARRTAAGGG